ncbi:hypothetical protein [Arhodomonas sp. SL1]|uniref:hypothetical protein n=1 Tax=Arhodomonas sp. SL1 TaxID=3425691 RepID=UPI003F884DC8
MFRVLVRGLQIVAALLGLAQVALMLPALSWLTAPGDVPPAYWAALGIKAAVAAITLAIAWGLGKLHRRIGGGSVASVQVRS